MYPSPSVVITFSTNISSPTANGNGLAVVNPAIGALILRVLTFNAELALIIPTPFELFTGINLIFLDNQKNYCEHHDTF